MQSGTSDRAGGRTQQERSAASTRRLLDAAVALIAEKGFERTTAIEIGERAGFSRSMVRSRWGSKEDLLASLFRDEVEPRLLAEGVTGPDGLRTALAQIARAREAVNVDAQLVRAFCVLCFETAGPLADLRPWLRGWLDRYHATIAAALEAGLADGSVRADVDPDRAAGGVVAAGLGLAFRWVIDPDVDYVSEMSAWESELAAGWAPR